MVDLRFWLVKEENCLIAAAVLSVNIKEDDYLS